MIKKALRVFYNSIPVRWKFIFKDIFVYVRSRRNGAIPVSRIIVDKDYEKVAVVGNGPSLKSDKKSFESMVNSHDFICVNNFCDDDLYSIIKPKLYVFLDAYFFSEEAHPDWVERREKTFSIIDRETNWPMQVVIPHGANQKVLERSITNSNVKIVKMATQGAFCKKYNWLLGRAFDAGLYGPPQINVLIYGVYLAVVLRYKDVYVYGADLSFHKDVSVNQETNDLYINFKHFNEEDSIEILRKNPEKIIKWRMAELLELSADTFYAHEVMASYAKEKNISICNKSSQSLIDAYPRSE